MNVDQTTDGLRNGGRKCRACDRAGYYYRLFADPERLAQVLRQRMDRATLSRLVDLLRGG